jgi:very-short-patch-repair endonuclease
VDTERLEATGRAPSPRVRGEGGVRGPRRMRGAKVTKTLRARRLRRDATRAEQRLWQYLRSRSLAGFKFVRQRPIGPYVVDFVCREKRLVIEVDGGQHAENSADAVRDRWLAAHRYRVLRFWNNEVLENIEGVWDTIFAAASAATPPHPDPLPAGGERELPRRAAE